MLYKKQRYSKRLRRKSKKGFRGFPVATVAFYGPTDQRATKVVVGIIRSEGAEVEPMKKWFSETSDVRTDQEIGAEVLSFIEENAVKTVVAAERLMGCPHEEGIDYPEGEKCPECPFWANRDRFTGEIID